MARGRLIAVLALLTPLAPAAACPWHGDMFGAEPGGYLSEPVALGPADQPASPAATSQPAPTRDEMQARQRALFLARYPGLAAGAKPAEPAAQTSTLAGNN